MTTSGVSHSKVSGIADGGDTTLVRPSDWNDDHVISYVKPSGLTGATAASRYVGATTQGAPTSGTFAVGDFVIDQAGYIIVCTVAGSPGTWYAVGKPGLDRTTFDATYGDDFNESSQNARWTNHNITNGQKNFQFGGRGSAVQFVHGGTNAAEYIYQTDPNNTNQTWEACLTQYQTNSTLQMYGILEVTSAGTGVGIMVYDNSVGYYLANIASHTYSSALATQTLSTSANWRSGNSRLWFKLRKASGTYFGTVSFDGETYLPEISGTPTSFTPTRIGVGRFLGTDAADKTNWHWFDKTA